MCTQGLEAVGEAWRAAYAEACVGLAEATHDYEAAEGEAYIPQKEIGKRSS